MTGLAGAGAVRSKAANLRPGRIQRGPSDSPAFAANLQYELALVGHKLSKQPAPLPYKLDYGSESVYLEGKLAQRRFVLRLHPLF
jgi:hypothetical protein